MFDGVGGGRDPLWEDIWTSLSYGPSCRNLSFQGLSQRWYQTCPVSLTSTLGGQDQCKSRVIGWKSDK